MLKGVEGGEEKEKGEQMKRISLLILKGLLQMKNILEKSLHDS